MGVHTWKYLPVVCDQRAECRLNCDHCSFEPFENVIDAFETAGMEYDEIESWECNVRFFLPYGGTLQFESWAEAVEWITGVVFDDPEVEERIRAELKK